MWNNDEQSRGQTTDSSASNVPRRSTELTRIGASVTLEGDLTCEEDLRLDGRLKGTVSVPQHRVLISSTGKVRANVFARVIEVEGQVRGDLEGAERVVVKATGNVVGNLRAPRVSLENGAQFKGSIDMEQAAETGAASRKGPRPSSEVSAPAQKTTAKVS
jgi:cytoskeletal protein CcmA (bactofilin family)